MALDYQEADPILLGSGELYLGTVANPETATEDAIQAALVNVGAIESGAELVYKPTIKEIESGNRDTVARIISKEEVTFSVGIITWNVDNLAIFSPASITTDATTGTKTVKIGNKGMLKTNYLRFIHTKDDGSTLTVNISKAQNTNGFKFGFNKDKALTNDCEFSALADNNGNLVEIIETFAEE